MKTDQQAYDALAEVIADPMQKRIKQHLLTLFAQSQSDDYLRQRATHKLPLMPPFAIQLLGSSVLAAEVEDLSHVLEQR